MTILFIHVGVGHDNRLNLRNGKTVHYIQYTLYIVHFYIIALVTVNIIYRSRYVIVFDLRKIIICVRNECHCMCIV